MTVGTTCNKGWKCSRTVHQLHTEFRAHMISLSNLSRCYTSTRKMSCSSNEEEYVNVPAPKDGINYDDNASYGVVKSSSKEELEEEAEYNDTEYCRVQLRRSRKSSKVRGPLVSDDQGHEYSQIVNKTSSHTGSTDKLVVGVNEEEEHSYTPMASYCKAKDFREMPPVPARLKITSCMYSHRVALVFSAIVMLSLLLVLLIAGVATSLAQISELRELVNDLQRNNST